MGRLPRTVRVRRMIPIPLRLAPACATSRSRACALRRAKLARSAADSRCCRARPGLAGTPAPGEPASGSEPPLVMRALIANRMGRQQGPGERPRQARHSAPRRHPEAVAIAAAPRSRAVRHPLPARPDHPCTLPPLMAVSARFGAPLWIAPGSCCRSSVGEHPLGKGEVVSSILPGSTRKCGPILIASADTCRTKPAFSWDFTGSLVRIAAPTHHLG